MAGLYIHIPFCKSRCPYCDFFSTTALERRSEYVDTLVQEIEERRTETDEPIRTIYIGGGTPSQLSAEQIARLIAAAKSPTAEEITVEVNPGDVSAEYLAALRKAGVNRLSMGVQSLHDNLLQLIGRQHNALQARQAIQLAKEAGFDNISVDLMYALPTQTMDMWKQDIDDILNMGIQHISCYGLMYEEGTVLTQQLMNGTLTAMDEETENAMYDYLCLQMTENGYIHYEVSNFALPGYESKHNSNYWNDTPYIGVGAGAHSYLRIKNPLGKEQHIRSWNPDNLDAYITGVQSKSLEREEEILTTTDLFNEYIMLGLRTWKGIEYKKLSNLIGVSCWLNAGFNDIVCRYEKQGLLRRDERHIVATQQGLHVLNRIIEELMMDKTVA